MPGSEVTRFNTNPHSRSKNRVVPGSVQLKASIMGGMFTERRVVTKSLGADLTSSAGVKTHVNNIVNLIGDQTTTSYRNTSRTKGDDGSLVDDFLRTTENGFKGRRTNNIHDNGHDFDSVRRRTVLSHHKINLRTLQSGKKTAYDGPIYPTRTGYTQVYPTVTKMSENDINFYGAKLIGMSIPNSPSVNVATFLAEIFREGFPAVSVVNAVLKGRVSRESLGLGKIFRNSEINPGTSGSEFLNYTFGWRPLISDLTSLLNTVMKVHYTLQQYVADGQNGLYVRRRRQLEPIATASTTQLGTGSIGPSGLLPTELFVGSNVGEFTLTETRTVRYWFSGAYSYHVAADKDLLSRMDRYANEAQKLLGLGLTPEVLWDLTPFSWLVDWQIDIGQVLSNASALQDDNLVMRWGYLMRQTDAVNTYAVSGVRFQSGCEGSVRRSFQVTRKERVHASPYGFSINPEQYNAGQWAIVAALGLTKAPRTLWNNFRG